MQRTLQLADARAVGTESPRDEDGQTRGSDGISPKSEQFEASACQNAR